MIKMLAHLMMSISLNDSALATQSITIKINKLLKIKKKFFNTRKKESKNACVFQLICRNLIVELVFLRKIFLCLV